MTETIFAIFYDDVAVFSVTDVFIWYLYSRILCHEGISIGSLTSLYGYCIIVHGHIAVFDEHILYYVKVNRIGRRSFGVVWFSKAVNMATDKLYVL